MSMNTVLLAIGSEDESRLEELAETAASVVDPDGRPVSGATIIVSGDSARLDGIATARTGSNGTATVVVAPTLGPNREQGMLRISIKPPAGEQYADRRGNTRVLVVAE